MNTQQQIKLKVLLIGDSCQDQYKIGTVDRLSPEAPVPVIKITKEFDLPGMAANVKLNLESLGILVDFITNKEIISKTRFIDQRSGQHLLRVDNEPKIIPWDNQLPESLNEYNAIIISDYDKGFLSADQIKNICLEFLGPIFIDTKKQDLTKFGFSNVFIKINEHEYKLRKSDPCNLIVTMGEKGAKLLSRNIDKTFPTKKVEVMDVCGCGDTFLAALTTYFLMTNNIELAIIYANQAAGITAQHRGNYAPTFNEIENGHRH